MSKIVERIPAYSDRQMLEYCGILYDVLSKSTYSDADALERIKNSFTHYGSKNMEFRPYQQDIINQGSSILKEHGFVFLAMEVRTGKTLTSLGIADWQYREGLRYTQAKLRHKGGQL
jgi:superfamily II DNA or RNA helicase